MSALCQKRTRAVQQRTSLFDHIVGATEHQWRHGETQRLGGLEVDHQLELSRQLDREVGWLGAFKDTVDVSCR
jgi:hypothetical protein